MGIKYKGILQNLLILFVSILVFLILFEFFLVFTAPVEKQFNGEPAQFCMYKDDPISDYVLWPDMETLQITREMSFYSKTNLLGLRESRELLEEENPEIVRIFFVGDSFVFGLGVNQDKTIPILLEKKLNETLSGQKFEVINLGVPGYNIALENKYFDRFKKFEPDVVLVGVNVTDMAPFIKDNCRNINNYKCIVDLPECFQEDKSIFDESFGNLKIYQFFNGRVGYFFSDKRLKDWEIEKNSLSELISKIKALNATPVIVIIPTPDVFTNTEFVKQQHKLIGDFAKDQGVLTIDLTDKVLKIAKEKQLYNRWTDSHFNEEGTDLAAEEIAKILEKELR